MRHALCRYMWSLLRRPLPQAFSSFWIRGWRIASIARDTVQPQFVSMIDMLNDLTINSTPHRFSQVKHDRGVKYNLWYTVYAAHHPVLRSEDIRQFLMTCK